MNPFRNPLVVATLAVVAGALVITNLIWPRAQGQRWRSAAPQLSTNAARPSLLPPQKSQPPLSPEATVLLARSSADWVAAEASLSRGQTPRRDPFHSSTEAEKRVTQAMILKAIWRQTGGNYAVINDRLVGEGDPISELRVEKIEPDRVWIAGPNGLEALEFGPPAKPPPVPSDSDANRP